MRVQLHSGPEREKIQAEIHKLGKQLDEKHKKRKEKILKATFGKIRFPEEKTPLEIQEEMRVGWLEKPYSNN